MENIVYIFRYACYRHYANMPMPYAKISKSCKNDNFQLRLFDFFHIFAQNIDCGYTLEHTIYVLEQK